MKYAPTVILALAALALTARAENDVQTELTVDPAASPPQPTGTVQRTPLPDVVGPGLGVGTVESAPSGGVPGQVMDPAVMAPPAPEEPSPVASIFSVEENPGKGSLTFIRGDASREIKLGKSHGMYALGLVFDTKTLPHPYKSEYGRNVVIQVVFGRIPSTREGTVAQFGSAALLGKFIPKRRTRYPLSSLAKGPTKRKLFARSSILMFMDPEIPASQSDEDKLRNTFFGVAGSIFAQPFGNPRTLTLSAEGESMVFRSQVLKVEFDAAVGTPFNPIDSTLQGTVEFPIYWPKGKNAQKLVDAIARQVFTGPDVRNRLPKAKRDVATPQKTLPVRRK